jgi:hypothetical protein
MGDWTVVRKYREYLKPNTNPQERLKLRMVPECVPAAPAEDRKPELNDERHRSGDEDFHAVCHVFSPVERSAVYGFRKPSPMTVFRFRLLMVSSNGHMPFLSLKTSIPESRNLEWQHETNLRVLRSPPR